MKQKLLCLVVGAAWLFAMASTEPLSAQTEGQWVQRGQYWYKGTSNVAYIQKKVYQPPQVYYVGGQAYSRPQTYYVKYELAPITAAVYPRVKNWREVHDEIAAAIVKGKTDATLLATDNDARLKSLRTLMEAQGGFGIKGQLGSLTYGSGGYLPQGDTAFGPSAYGNYTVNAVAARFATEIDMNVLLQGNMAFAQRALDGGVTLGRGMQELTGQIADANARIQAAQSRPGVSATATARGAGATANVGAVRPRGDGSTFTPISPAGTPPPGGPAPAVAPGGDLPADVMSAVKVVLDTACISCHGNTGAKKGLVLTDASRLTPDQWDAIVWRAHTRNKEEVMPPADKGQLTREAKDALLAAAMASRRRK